MPAVELKFHRRRVSLAGAEHQAFDTVNQVKEILAGRMPPGAANAAAAHRLSVFGTR